MAVTHSLDLETSSSQYATIADGSCPNLEISGSKTWEAWVKPESVSIWQYIMSKFHNVNQDGARLAINGSTNQFRFQCDGHTTNTVVQSVTTAQAGVWYHVAAVYDSGSSQLRMYINGELETTVTSSGSTTDSNAAFDIGSNSGDQHLEQFDGLVRNVRVWNDVRTQDEIRDNMNIDNPADTTNMQGNWLLNNDYTDESSNGYDLTASGSPVFATSYPDALDLTENSNWSSNHKITIDSDQVSGSSDLTDFPILLTEDNFLSSVFTAAQTGELSGTNLVNDANLQGYWKLEDVNDSSSNAYNLTNNGTATFSSGRHGNAVSTSTTGPKYLSIADASCANLEISGSQTWACWVKAPSETPEGNVMRKSDAGTVKDIYITSGVPHFRLQGLTTTSDISAEVTLAQDTWYHIAGVYDSSASKIYIYINGKLANSATASGSATDTNGIFFIGSAPSGSNAFDGQIDDACIFNRALTATEIATLYGGGDLRFSLDLAGEQRLAHEVVSWDDSASTAVVFVKINTLSYNTDTDIYVHYGNGSTVGLNRAEAFGMNQAWFGNYVGVWHLETIGSISPNSTATASINITKGGTVSTVTGKIGSGASKSATSGNYLRLTDTAALQMTTDLTWEFWGKTASNGAYYINKDDGSSNREYYLAGVVGSNGQPRWTVKTSSTFAGVDSADTQDDDTWHYIAATLNSSDTKRYLYIDGAADAASPSGAQSGSIPNTSAPINILADGQATPAGAAVSMDELRLSNVARSADWIATTYNNQNSPSTFATPISGFTPKMILIS